MQKAKKVSAITDGGIKRMEFYSCKDTTCCFIGHRKVEETEELKEKLKETIERLMIEYGVTTFLFGSRSQFNDLCLKTVTELKEKYPDLKRIYVRAEFPYISEKYKAGLLERYEETYYPERILKAGSAVYVERNREMIDNSKFCIAYYNENYLPPTRKKKLLFVTEFQPKSGTGLAMEYAKQKGVEVINLFS